jgi:hypothetical protein
LSLLTLTLLLAWLVREEAGEGCALLLLLVLSRSILGLVCHGTAHHGAAWVVASAAASVALGNLCLVH